MLRLRIEALRPGAQLLSLLAPPRCVACGGLVAAAGPLCPACGAELEALPLPPPISLRELDASWAAVPHRGIARELVAALKFRRLLAVAGPIAQMTGVRAPPGRLAGTIVAVPAAPARSLWRGFDPAEEIASRLAAASGLEQRACLRRADARPQVGRSRAARLADPPRVWASGNVPDRVLLVDDVLTTGATLRACAAALRDAGAVRVAAVAFARTL